MTNHVGELHVSQEITLPVLGSDAQSALELMGD